jgi:NAD(P)-dependent dehydrogenase (short-subunit alcohol dehydrogenase family)
MPLDISFQDQTVLVTGGTRGIGQAIAQESIACRGHVIITGTGNEAPSWLKKVQTNFPEQIIDYVPLDFAQAGWPDRLDQLMARHPYISVCINNAAINIVADIRNVAAEDLRKVLEVNLVAPAIVAARVAPAMADKGYGRIVNISSIFGVGSRAGFKSRAYWPNQSHCLRCGCRWNFGQCRMSGFCGHGFNPASLGRSGHGGGINPDSCWPAGRTCRYCSFRTIFSKQTKHLYYRSGFGGRWRLSCWLNP